MKRFSITLLLLSGLSLTSLSCSNFHKGRNLASQNELTCHELLSHFRSIEDFKAYNKFKKYAKYNDPLEFQKFEGQAYKKIKFWAETGNRQISVQQMKHNGAFSSIKTAFDVDSPFAIARQFTSLIYEAETSYFISRRAFKEAVEIEKVLKFLDTAEQLDEAHRQILENYMQTNLLTKKSQLTKKDFDLNSKKLKKKLVKDLSNLNEIMITYAHKLADRYDEYAVVRKYIEKQLAGGNPKAIEVQEKLSPKKLLSGCHLCGETENLLRPTMESMDALANKLNIVRVMHLKKRLMLEKWLTISSRLPTQYVYQIIDKVLQKFPFLNDSKFRKWLRTGFIDFKDKHRYFPNIDRFIFSESSEEELVLLMRDIVGTEGDNFLVTFARRVDAQNEWKKIYSYLKNNQSSDTRDANNILKAQMDKAWDEAVKRGPMAEWHNPTSTGVMRFVIDLSFYVSGAYLSYNYMAISEIEEEALSEVENLEVENELTETLIERPL